MRAPGSMCIFTVLAISAMRGPQNGWLAGSHFSEFIHAFSAACMHSGLPAACGSDVDGIFSQPASQPARAPWPPDMARTADGSEEKFVRVLQAISCRVLCFWRLEIQTKVNDKPSFLNLFTAVAVAFSRGM
eukprot:COSAG05_NODE_1406_length_4967_cov_7.938180_1_plen_131_part_00